MDALRAGARLGNITLESPLGEGNMGAVWRGRMDLVDTPVAVKVMHTESATDTEHRKRFLDEARAMALLQHERIVPLKNFFFDEASGRFVMVMPLMEGRTLEQVIEAAPHGLPVEDVLRYATDVLSALQYAHSCTPRIVHRDVKPSNILITPDRKAFLMDFGIAKMFTEARSSQTVVGTFMGTVLYMSPEQIRSPEGLDGRADMYSFACVAYEALTGTPVFLPKGEAGEQRVSLQVAHLNELPVSLRTHKPSIPAELDAVILKALSKGPTERYPDCAAMAEALRLAGSTAPADFRRTRLESGTVVESIPPPTAAPVPVNRTKLIAAGGVLVMLGVAGWAFSGVGNKAQDSVELPAKQIEATAPAVNAGANLKNPLPVVTPTKAGPAADQAQTPPPVQPNVQPPTANQPQNVVAAPPPVPVGLADYQRAQDFKRARNYCRANESLGDAIEAAAKVGQSNPAWESEKRLLANQCDLLGPDQ